MTVLQYSIIFITAALIFYTAGVWSEHYKKRLLLWHVIFFWLGVTTDAIGTGLMIEHVGHIKFTVHTITGFIGISLMLVHALWATKVIIQNNQKSITSFHKFSLFVWTLWFISYVSGVVMGMKSIS